MASEKQCEALDPEIFDATRERFIPSPELWFTAFPKVAYVWWSRVQFGRFSYPDFRVTIDGVVHQAISVIVANAR